ncbi:chromate transporter [Ascobolus immersus RN42]|uniref:Chromate transporter n=1 Tax=Ascobolus immersus RN42 TaxID=1160509 RepID=A0A3N4HHR3_ASCIM|nr:chromate transporter [Ascobolus immersus RN42]
MSSTSQAFSAFKERASRSKTGFALYDTFLRTWDLGITAFGGPPTHFKILNDRFVEKYKWLTPSTSLELFALSQSLPGPASTKFLFCITLLRHGLFSATLAFVFWSLPGALGMYGFSLGVSKISETLPGPVYALLSGLNGATVGIVALAAVELARKAVTDRLTRLCVFLSAAAGLLYNALWYFPVLMVGCGFATLAWDMGFAGTVWRVLRGKKRQEPVEELGVAPTSVDGKVGTTASGSDARTGSSDTEQEVVEQADTTHLYGWKTGLAIVVAFFITFAAVLIARGLWDARPLAFSVFANFYLAGTIIFGGGPVVIPLLREYIVAPGWVSSRDFLLGLAVIQSFPGPNFNFAVYLGSLAALSARPTISSFPSFAGALVGFFGIFTPGIVLSIGFMAVWKTLRKKRWVASILRGINAGAVGLIFTAVYRLFQIGLVDAEHQQGSSLGNDPWWVVVTATSFVGGAWFKVPPPLAIALGGVMGLIWYGIVHGA